VKAGTPTVVPKGDEDALQELLDKIESEVKNTWGGKWTSKDASVEVFVTDAY